MLLGDAVNGMDENPTGALHKWSFSRHLVCFIFYAVFECLRLMLFRKC